MQLQKVLKRVPLSQERDLILNKNNQDQELQRTEIFRLLPIDLFKSIINQDRHKTTKHR